MTNAEASRRYRAKRRGEYVPPIEGRSMFGCPSGTPEYRRMQRERDASSKGRVMSPWVRASDRKGMKNMLRAERMADYIRWKFQESWRHGMYLAWKGTEDYLSQCASKVKNAYWDDPSSARHRKRIYKASNPDKVARYAGMRGRRMADTADGSLSAGNLNRMFDHATCCDYCGKGFSRTEEKSLEHFIPLCLGGRHSISNVLIACLDCNHSKNQTHPYIWLGEIEFERWVARLRGRGAGDPCEENDLYPHNQVQAA